MHGTVAERTHMPWRREYTEISLSQRAACDESFALERCCNGDQVISENTKRTLSLLFKLFCWMQSVVGQACTVCFPTRIHVRVGTSSWEKLLRESEPEKLLEAHEGVLAYSTSPSGKQRGVFAELGAPGGEWTLTEMERGALWSGPGGTR